MDFQEIAFKEILTVTFTLFAVIDMLGSVPILASLREKMGGTIHIALGSAYKQTGSKNESSLHWDMILDLKNGGELYADGELFYRNGKFLF